MEKSSKHLVECCLLDLLPTNISTLVDYFGINNVTDKEIFMIIFGIYQGLIKFKGVSENLLHKCCLSGRLNELIHKKFKFMPTRYYEKFCNKKIKIDSLYTNKMYFKIYDDDHCPKCNAKGFITETKALGIDCPKCLHLICKECYKKIENTDGYVVYYCNECD